MRNKKEEAMKHFKRAIEIDGNKEAQSKWDALNKNK